MPPKPAQHRRRKPFTPLERKIQKKKHELIHKATVKNQYKKTLTKQDASLDTPDYVKEIFAERTVDDDGNVQVYQRNEQQSKPNPFKAQIKAQKKSRQEAGEERAARAKEREEKEMAIKAYKKSRSNERGKMLARNSRGQPNMATQMDVLLGKIKKQVAKE